MDHLQIIIDQDFSFSVSISALFLGILIGIGVIFTLSKIVISRGWWGSRFEIDEAQFGIGDQRITIRPNDLDRQIAYKIWVELSTRKVGLPLDLENDVISEVYDSWYSFFSVTRELVKDVPVSRFRRKDTEQIIKLSIDVLNTGIRPHLTRWQARFRRWYERELEISDNASLCPQEIQEGFPDFEALKSDILMVNQNLIGYRRKMYELVSNL